MERLEEQSGHWLKRWWLHIALFGVAVVFAFGYLATIPRFDISDEGFYMRQAAERIHHLPHPFNLAYVTSFSPQYPETPFYSLLLAGYFKIAGLSVAAGRFSSSLILLGIIAISAGIAQIIQGKRASLFTIVGFLGTPYFWYFGRHVTPHTLIIFLILLSLFFVLKYQQKSSWALLVSAIAPVLAAVFISHWAIVYSLVLPFLLIRKSGWRWVAGALPFLSLVAYWFERYSTLGQLFIDDVKRFFPWMRSGGFVVRTGIVSQLSHAAIQVVLFIFSAPVTFLGSIGLFFIKDRWTRWALAILYYGGALFVFRDRLMLITPYVSTFLIPFSVIGFGILIDRAWTWASTTLGKYSPQAVRIVLVCCVLAVCSLQVFFFIPHIKREIDEHAGSEGLIKIQNVTDFVNARTTPNDFVLASQEVFWRLKTKSTEYLAMYVYGSSVNGTWDMLYPKTREYYSFVSSLDAAAFVIDRREFTATYGPDFQSLYAPMYSWEKVYDDGVYTVYKHP